MSEQDNVSKIVENQISAAVSLAQPMFGGVATAIGAQAGCLQQMEKLTVDLLHHQREACVATQRLVERLGAAHDFADVVSAQQEWLGGAVDRMLAGAACWQSAGTEIFNETGRQLQRFEKAEDGFPAASRPGQMIAA